MGANQRKDGEYVSITGQLSELIGGRFALSDLFVVHRQIARAKGTLGQDDRFCAWKIEGTDGDLQFIFSVPITHKEKDNDR